jgi:adenylate kinase family enzyme
VAHAVETTATLKWERINVVGTSGSGKSTFARQLAGLLDLPYHERDRFFWKRGWQPASDEELFRKVEEATSQPRWVLDGNYTRTLPIKWKRVQLVQRLDGRSRAFAHRLPANENARERHALSPRRALY